MKIQRCENCHFSVPCNPWHVLCRRYPPSVGLGLGAENPVAPKVRIDGWCGEWREHGKRPAEPQPETSQERMFKWFWR